MPKPTRKSKYLLLAAMVLNIYLGLFLAVAVNLGNIKMQIIDTYGTGNTALILSLTIACVVFFIILLIIYMDYSLLKKSGLYEWIKTEINLEEAEVQNGY